MTRMTISLLPLRVHDHPEDVLGSTNSPPFDHPQKVPGPYGFLAAPNHGRSLSNETGARTTMRILDTRGTRSARSSFRDPLSYRTGVRYDWAQTHGAYIMVSPSSP